MCQFKYFYKKKYNRLSVCVNDDDPIRNLIEIKKQNIKNREQEKYKIVR